MEVDDATTAVINQAEEVIQSQQTPPQQQQQIARERKYAEIQQDNFYLIGLLMSFFDSPNEPVNVTSAGYVTKVLVSLLNLARSKAREFEVCSLVRLH